MEVLNITHLPALAKMPDSLNHTAPYYHSVIMLDILDLTHLSFYTMDFYVLGCSGLSKLCTQSPAGEVGGKWEQRKLLQLLEGLGKKNPSNSPQSKWENTERTALPLPIQRPLQQLITCGWLQCKCINILHNALVISLLYKQKGWKITADLSCTLMCYSTSKTKQLQIDPTSPLHF